MHFDQTSGHNWFKPVITGRLVVDCPIEKKNMVDVKILSISYSNLLDSIKRLKIVPGLIENVFHELLLL